MSNERIQAMVDAQIAELMSRGGFDGWWGDIDEDIQDDIRTTLIAIAIDHIWEAVGVEHDMGQAAGGYA